MKTEHRPSSSPPALFPSLGVYLTSSEKTPSRPLHSLQTVELGNTNKRRCPPQSPTNSPKSRTSDQSSTPHNTTATTSSTSAVAAHATSRSASTATSPAATPEPHTTVEASIAREHLLPPRLRTRSARVILYVKSKAPQLGGALGPTATKKPRTSSTSIMKKRMKARDLSPPKRCSGAGAPMGLAMPSLSAAMVR
jgi:hypothetical protein